MSAQEKAKKALVNVSIMKAFINDKKEPVFPSPPQCSCSAILFSLFLIIGINDRKASFTEFSFGKNSATSGSMITTFVPF